jgi:hypothetical protein
VRSEENAGRSMHVDLPVSAGEAAEDPIEDIDGDGASRSRDNSPQSSP